MTALVSFVNKALSLGVIVSQLFLLALILYSVFLKKTKNKIVTLIGKHGIELAFATALISTCASLFYSQIAGFAPCELCWFQRIFMYPQVLLLGLALYKKERHIIDYALSLSVVGAMISLYHNYIYYGKMLSPLCDAAGKGVSCTTKFVVEFGYVTIPMMALTGFILTIAFLLFSKKHATRSN